MISLYTVIMVTIQVQIPMLLSLQSRYQPHDKLVKLSATNFICMIHQHAFQLEHRCNIIANEQKNLLYVYQSETFLKEGIDFMSSQSRFKDGWSLLAWLPVAKPDGVATLFPGTSTVESDFSTGLSDFGLEGVLQTKQFLFIEQYEP